MNTRDGLRLVLGLENSGRCDRALLVDGRAAESVVLDLESPSAVTTALFSVSRTMHVRECVAVSHDATQTSLPRFLRRWCLLPDLVMIHGRRLVGVGLFCHSVGERWPGMHPIVHSDCLLGNNYRSCSRQYVDFYL